MCRVLSGLDLRDQRACMEIFRGFLFLLLVGCGVLGVYFMYFIINYQQSQKIMSQFNNAIYYMQTIDKSGKIQILLKSVLLGAVSGMASLPFEHPFDALKTNMQSRQLKMVPTIQAMMKEKGWKSFYNGFSLNLLRIMFKQAYRWPLWIYVSSFYKRQLPRTNQVLRQTVTGFTITICQLLIITPLQRIKVWLMTTKTQQQTKIRNYYNKEFSFLDLYKGFISMLFRQGLSWSSFLASSQVSKNFIRQFKGKEHLDSWDLFIASIPVAMINTIFIMPMDCIKTFYQKYQGSLTQKTFPQVVKKMFNNYGLKGLYLGWSARIIQYQIQSAFTLILIQDLLTQYFKKNKQ